MNTQDFTGVRIKRKDFFNLPEHCRCMIDQLPHVLSKDQFVRAIIF